MNFSACIEATEGEADMLVVYVSVSKSSPLPVTNPIRLRTKELDNRPNYAVR